MCSADQTCKDKVHLINVPELFWSVLSALSINLNWQKDLTNSRNSELPYIVVYIILLQFHRLKEQAQIMKHETESVAEISNDNVRSLMALFFSHVT